MAIATINDAPHPNLGPDTCVAASSYTLDPGTFSAYLWQDNSTGATYNVTSSGTYWVRVDSNSCQSYDTVDVIMAIQPTAHDTTFRCL
jgi:hypothetical protein